MKLKLKKNDIVILAVQLLLAVVLVFGIPIGTQMMMSRKLDIEVFFGMTLPWLVPVIFVYFINFYGLVPYLYARKRRLAFFLVNIILIALSNLHYVFMVGHIQNAYAHAGFNMFLVVIVVMNMTMVGFAIGMRYIMKLNRVEMELKEIKQKNTEAELSWLRNQLNPHFLFNALNNISSLTQIDADEAQDSIAQLSDLLRYAMYEARNEWVTIGRDVDFMVNYIAMMKLRCSDKTTVTTTFDIENREAEISPMLFISFIENAFKHGVSNSNASFIDIRLTQNDDAIVFECSNSDFHKTAKDRSGQGVGLANTKRRLELLYRNSFTWKQECKDGVFTISIRIKSRS